MIRLLLVLFFSGGALIASAKQELRSNLGHSPNDSYLNFCSSNDNSPNFGWQLGSGRSGCTVRCTISSYMGEIHE